MLRLDPEMASGGAGGGKRCPDPLTYEKFFLNNLIFLKQIYLYYFCLFNIISSFNSFKDD